MAASVGAFAWGAGVLLGAIRIAVLFIATPVFGGVPVPASAKIVLVLGLAGGLMLGAGVVPTVPGGSVSLIAAVVSELAIGLMLAAGLFAGFAAFHLGGRLIDFQIGYGVANLIDIATRSSAPLLGTALSMLAALVFFTVGGHLGLVKVIALSYEAFPPGGGLAAFQPGAVAAQFAVCFSFGLLIVAPVVLSLLIVDFGMALMSRTMPQMNVFVMSLALKVLIGLSVLALSVPFAGGVMQRVFESVFGYWQAAVS